MNNQRKNLKFLWLALSAVLSLFVGARWNFPLAAWLAPVFAIRFYRDSEKGGRAFLWLWLAMAAPTIMAWKGLTAMAFFHPLAEPVFFIVFVVPLSLVPYVVDRLYY
ncbi:MAG: hypothetical protein U9N80_10240, partial [Chloroflexota bacterium]|nr:hypothetical protein [Chloroflexota bacterium]